MEKGELPKPFTMDQLKQADLALSKGIKIDDPQYDFFQFPPNSFQPDGRPDNSDPYPLPWTNLKSLSVGADANYMYVKFEFWGEFPYKMVTYNGDDIMATGAKLTEFTFTNKDGQEDSAELGDGVDFVEYRGENKFLDYVPAKKPTLGQLAMLSPTGQDEQLETIYKTMNGAGMVGGGAGYNYVIGAYPLNELGLKFGDEVVFSCSTETGSKIYHHEAIDLLLDEDNIKFGSRIKYKLGNDQYEILPPKNLW
jgi:hypothetical protein